MSRAIPVVSVLLLCLPLAAPAQQDRPPAQKPQPPSADRERVKNTDGQPAPKPRADVKVERLVYAVRGGSAKELANALSFSFKDEGAFQVFPDAGSNSLLLSGPEPVLDEAVKVLRDIDRPARAVHVEVFFLEPKAEGAEGEKDLEPAGLTGPVAEVTARIRDLQRRGVLAGLKRVQVTALERQPAQVKVVESRPFVTGVSGTRTGLATRSVTYRDSGTTVEVTPQVGADGTATLQLRAEDSRMQTPEANPTLGPDEKGESVKAANFVTATFEGPVRVRLGQAVLAQGMRSTAKAGEGQVLIVVAAAEEPAPRDKK